MHRFDYGNLVLTPDGVGIIQFYRSEEKTYGVRLDTTTEQVFIYPAQAVCSIDGRLQALQDVLSKLCTEAIIWNGYLPSSIAAIIREANQLLSKKAANDE
jgi:hypothetical protein